MTRIIEIEKFGNPETLTLKRINLPAPRGDEVLIRHTAIGINRIDIFARRAEYSTKLPFIPGFEACGIVESVGSNVKNFTIGDRVAYVDPAGGAYCESRVINQDLLISIPNYVDDDDVAACLMKGMTAHYLTRRTFFVRKNNYILIQGASQDVGLLICQMAKQYEAKVIAVVKDSKQKEAVKKAGANFVLYQSESNFMEKINEFTDGEKVSVSYDFIGKETIRKSHDALSEFGLLVCAGFATGVPEEISFNDLHSKSSFVTCPNFFHYKNDKMELVLSANEIFAQLQKKLITPSFYKKYTLEEIMQAHIAIENDEQLGQSIIVV